MKLQNKSILITGASSGMGKSMAELFANEGANLVILARRGELLQEIADSLKNAPGKVTVFVGDVTKKEDCEAAVDAAVQAYGKLDVLVNNAGIMDDFTPIAELKDEVLEQVFATNIYGPIYLTRKAVKVFLEQGQGGNIINISSLGALHSTAGVSYSSSKAALLAMTRNTAFMYIPQKIRCNAIAPGRIETGIRSMGGLPNLAGFLRSKPLIAMGPTPGVAEDIAKAALFLASDDSSYITGDVMLVDGGWGTV